MEKKSSSTKEILGIEIGSYRKWIEFQMTPDLTWDNIKKDHVKPNCLFDISNIDELKESFCWKKNSFVNFVKSNTIMIVL